MATHEPLATVRKYRDGTISNITGVTLRMALFDDSTAYTWDPVNHEFLGDVLDGGTTAQELGDATYSRQDVTNVTVSVDATYEETVLDADDVTFSGLDGGETIQGWIIYQQVGGDDTTPGDDHIIAIEDEVTNANGNAVTTNGSDVVISINSEGIINVSV